MDESNKFLVLYPDQWTEYELAHGMSDYLVTLDKINGKDPIDINALVTDPDYREALPGGVFVIQATEGIITYYNDMHFPENPLYQDAAYAQNAGYEDIPAIPSFAAFDDHYYGHIPPMDKKMVSDLNHSITSLAPIYPGDTLYLVIDKRTLADITPKQGSTYRSIVIQTEGSIYNQRYEKVNEVVFRITEANRVYTEAYADEIGGHSDPTDFRSYWAPPNWLSRPEHYYTDEDWDYLKGIWEEEEKRGNKPRYWEDVKVGDKPSWTLQSPVYSNLTPGLSGVENASFGPGLFASRSIKAEIMAEDPTLFRSGLDGIYYLQPDPDAQIPERKDLTKGHGMDDCRTRLALGKTV